MKKIAVIESLRGAAACYVVAYHFVGTFFDKRVPCTWPFLFGREAVMLFFIISGFVIARSMILEQDKSFRSYLQRRVFRIYPIFLLALLFSYLMADPDSNIDLHTLLGNIFMLQDSPSVLPEVPFHAFGDNISFWSLSYEWWFYVAFFPVFFFVRDTMRAALVAGTASLAIVAYNLTYFHPFLFVAYFPVWWAGAEIGTAAARDESIPFRRIFAMLGVIVAAFAVFLALDAVRGVKLMLGTHPVMEFRDASSTIVIIMGLMLYRRFALNLGWLIAPFAMLAPISYGIYAVHFPIIQKFADLNVAIALPLIVAAVLAAGWFAEVPYQRLVMTAARSRSSATATPSD